MAALALMETIGGLLAPVTLGVVQSAMPGRNVFFVEAGMCCAAFTFFGVGAIIRRRGVGFEG